MVGLKMIRSLLTTAILLSSALASASEPALFEGYYRVLKGGQHVGYYIMKHEFDAKKKQFIATTFMRLEGVDDTTESIKAVATENFKPISFSYTAAATGMTRTIDVKVDKNKLVGTLSNLGAVEKIAKPINANTISSLFLVYAILRSPQGLKTNAVFDYEAIAEELAEGHKGTVKMGANEEYAGQKVIRIENTFLDTKSTNLVTDRGEVLATTSPAQKISIELVAKPENAIGKFRLQTGLLKALFGEIPAGKDNVLAKSGYSDPALPSTSVTKPAEEAMPATVPTNTDSTPPTKAPAKKQGK